MIRISEPTLILDKRRCMRNIKRMVAKAAASGTRLRPHFKTHQSLAIGEWFKAYGVTAITVSSAKMAQYFSAAWDDITIAFPANILEVERINRIPESCQLNLCVESSETVTFLEDNLQRPIGAYIKVDVGCNRTGLTPEDGRIDAIAESLGGCKRMAFRGFLSHAGQSYNAGSKAAIAAVDRRARDIMATLQARFADRFGVLETSLGDTPTCSIARDFTGVTEMRPGNFVFYDLMQYQLGSCAMEDIALVVACPVVARHRGKLVIHGGGVHLSQDRLKTETGADCFGRVAEVANHGWGNMVDGLNVSAVSQEHGIVSGPDELLDKYDIGSVVLVLPVHSCMTAHAMRCYRTLDGETLLHLEAEYPRSTIRSAESLPAV